MGLLFIRKAEGFTEALALAMKDTGGPAASDLCNAAKPENYFPALYMKQCARRITEIVHIGGNMKNFIQINGKKIDLTEEQVQKIVGELEIDRKKSCLAEIEPGKTFKIGNTEFVVLAQCGEMTEVITKSVLEKMYFGTKNNLNGSKVDRYCKEFAETLINQIGEENLVEHVVDLTSDDGLKDYGYEFRKVSLLTANQYREYVDILDLHKPDCWWWLATPFSTPRHENDAWIKCVSPAGNISYDSYNFGNYGVRPFCILKSSIFVSCGN